MKFDITTIDMVGLLFIISTFAKYLEQENYE